MNSLVIAQAASGGFNPSLILMVALFAVLIFMMFRGRKKQSAQQEKLKNNTVPGAKVMTNSGIFGTVVGIDAEDRVQVEVANGVVLTLHRQAISTFLDNEPAAAATEQPAETNDVAETPEESLRRLNDEGKDERNS
ncbi:preprotein translocase subunit YajC [Glutamicibacter halophytocola]|uniref:preprotein translocase subunit YajC n=1 Tax=Glutamicibacter halophytocola TaxID=1933880 RepID=UPI0028165408|nr:preprotein translocase subunit YajC [Glutamicibacter halophytocola]